MSKQKRTKSMIARMSRKRHLKEQKRLLYASYAQRGANCKSKRYRQSTRKKKLVANFSHPDGECGNPGCEECFGINFHPFLLNGQPCNMSQRMYFLWKQAENLEK